MARLTVPPDVLPDEVEELDALAAADALELELELEPQAARQTAAANAAIVSADRRRVRE
ncbi:MAG: hypothetical protein ACLP50_00555 [Solirubrobacteraceae bacterium]